MLSEDSTVAQIEEYIVKNALPKYSVFVSDGKEISVCKDKPPPISAFVLLPFFNHDEKNIVTGEFRTREIISYFFLDPHSKPENCAVLKVLGDSMKDIALSSGDFAIFNRAQVSGDGIHVIVHGGHTRIKRLHYRFSEKRVEIISENQHYKSEYESIELIGVNLIVVGKVIGWMHSHTD